jgi:deoxyribonuclease (pyrimidine dimer)
VTRINSNLDPKSLKRMHLIAELREITMVPAALRRSLRTIDPTKIKQSIPKQFTLNAGHVKFFYDKLGFLQKRFNRLADEMVRRGYAPDRSRIKAFDGFDSMWYNDWTSTDTDDKIVVERINFRISQKPHLYKD